MSFALQINDLLAHRVTSTLAPTAPSTLSTPIHRIWKQKNFRVGDLYQECRNLPIFGGVGWDRPETIMSNDMYERIRPALQLATIFLQIAKPFFIKVMWADLEDFPTGHYRSRSRSPSPSTGPQVLDENFMPSSEDLADYDFILDGIANYYRIFTGGSGDAWGGYGVTHLVNDLEHPVIMGLASEHFQVFESPRYESMTPEALRSAWFMLALTCVHELAHAVFMDRQIDEDDDEMKDVGEWQGRGKCPEPFYSPTDPEIELGAAVEHYLFGGSVESN